MFNYIYIYILFCNIKMETDIWRESEYMKIIMNSWFLCTLGIILCKSGRKLFNICFGNTLWHHGSNLKAGTRLDFCHLNSFHCYQEDKVLTFLLSPKNEVQTVKWSHIKEWFSQPGYHIVITMEVMQRIQDLEHLSITA